MANPLVGLIEKHAGADFLPRLKQCVIGFAEDFWKDGGYNPLATLMQVTKKGKPAAPFRDFSQVKTPAVRPPWTALPGEIAEKMWGPGYVMPADKMMADALMMPLGLKKETTVLDISAGLGGRLRAAADKYGITITGLEQDARIAARGMEMSITAGKGAVAPIAAYNPAHFSVADRYDCIVAREVFYGVIKKESFFTALAAAAKPKTQISFTDYVVNPEDREKPAIVNWQKFEAGASPIGLVEVAEVWAKAGFNISVHEDLTDMYRQEIVDGLKRFAGALARGAKPDAQTKRDVLAQIQIWVHRMGALQQGMKFYRFYGTKL